MCESLQMKNVLAYANFKFMTYVKFHSNYLRNSGHSSIHKLATLYADKPTHDRLTNAPLIDWLQYTPNFVCQDITNNVWANINKET